MYSVMESITRFAGRLTIAFSAAILLVLPGVASAAWATNNITISTLGTQTFNNGNADQNHAGTAIGNWTSTMTATVWSGGALDYFSGYTWAMASQSAIAGVTYTDSSSGQSYPVYPTGVPNIGVVVGIADAGVSTLKPFTAAWTQVWTGSAWGSVGFGTRARLVATGPLRAGTYTIPAQIVASLKATSDAAGTSLTGSVATLSISGATVTVTAQSCVVTAGKNQVVTLPTVSVGNFHGVGSSPSAANSFNMQLSCPAGIALYATMTDATTPGNTGNYLTLSPATTSATGVGVQIYANGSTSPVSFGPDSSYPGNTNQWYVGGSASSPSTAYNIPFTVRYVQTAATMTAGSVEALATITFSYQ
ncbi:type 1 fimbria pilin [Paraburkholderia silvatlantica]|nr:type 1 fimbria pilin [Paraburkholderia silvatlantica]